MDFYGRDAQFIKTRQHPKYLLSKTDFFALLFFLIVANLFVISFVTKEHYIYYGDYAYYWDAYREIYDLFRSNPLAAIELVITRIRYEDYNYLATLFLLPFGFLFGKERLPYILSIVNISALLSAISFILLYKSIVNKLYNAPSSIVSFIAIFIAITFPFLWCPILLGYPDIGGIFIINLILLVYLKHPFSEQNIRNLIILSLLMFMLVLFRRWYAYWAVSFYIALTINEFIFSFTRHHFEWKKYLVSLKKLLWVIFVPATLFLLFAMPVALRHITADYPDIHSAFRFNATILQSLGGFCKDIGMFYVMLFLSSCVYALFHPNIKKFSFFLLLQWIVIFLLFSRTQDFNPHHYYLLLPTMLLFISLFGTHILLKTKTKIATLIICLGYILITLLNSLAMFVPRVSQLTERIGYVFSSIGHYPYVRKDFNEIERLLNILKNLLTNPNERVYILSSSGALNSSILHHAYLALKCDKTIENQILSTRDVDKRDGFPSEFLTAKYVVVASPTQYHLRPEDQRIVGILAESIINRQNIGTSYVQLPYEFVLDGNVKVYIYEKAEYFRKIDIDSLSKTFRKYYPDRKYLYQINGI